MDQSVMQEDWFAAFKFRVTVKAHLIRYDCFYHICWTADLFATRFNWIVHHHKLECFLWKLDCCFQGQGHSDGSKLCWISMYLISSVLLISWQSWCTYLLLIITKPSTTKWAYTDSSTLTYTITRHTIGEKGGGVFCCTRQQALFSFEHLWDARGRLCWWVSLKKVCLIGLFFLVCLLQCMKKISFLL